MDTGNKMLDFWGSVTMTIGVIVFLCALLLSSCRAEASRGEYLESFISPSMVVSWPVFWPILMEEPKKYQERFVSVYPKFDPEKPTYIEMKWEAAREPVGLAFLLLGLTSLFIGFNMRSEEANRNRI